MSLLGGLWSPPGVSRSGVSNGNNRKNDNPLIVVPSVNVLFGAAAGKHPKLMTPPSYSPNPLAELARILEINPSCGLRLHLFIK